jgi:hypothetical protein
MNTDSPRPIRSEKPIPQAVLRLALSMPWSEVERRKTAAPANVSKRSVGPPSPRRLAGLRRGFPLTANGFLHGAESGSLAEQPRGATRTFSCLEPTC